MNAKGTAVVPALIMQSFPEWFAGFCCAAIALGALVPAAIMSIGAANLVTRNIWRPYINKNMTPAQESNVAKITSLLVKAGALLFVGACCSSLRSICKSLGGIWILQIFPAVILGLYTRWFNPRGLLIGWAGRYGTLGTTLSWMQGVKPIYPLPGIGGVYIGLTALAVNVIVAAVITLALGAGKSGVHADAMQLSDYEDAPGTV